MNSSDIFIVTAELTGSLWDFAQIIYCILKKERKKERKIRVRGKIIKTLLQHPPIYRTPLPVKTHLNSELKALSRYFSLLNTHDHPLKTFDYAIISQGLEFAL